MIGCPGPYESNSGNIYPTARRNGRPFGGGRGLARSPHQKSRLDAPSTLTKCMKSPRPKRLRKERVPWEAAVASTLDTAKKAERKAPRTDGDCVYVPSHGRHQMGVNSGVQWDTSKKGLLPFERISHG